MKFDPCVRNRIKVWHEAGVKKGEILRRVNVELRRSHRRTKVSRKRIQGVIDSLYRKPKKYCKKGLTEEDWKRVTATVKDFYKKNKKASRRMAINHVRTTLSVQVYCRLAEEMTKRLLL